MTVIVTWHHEPYILYAKVVGEYTLEDMEIFHRQLITDYLSNTNEPVHLIIDLNHMTRFPKQIIKIKNTAAILLNHPMMGWMVPVGKENPIVDFFASVITQTFHVKFRWEKTLEEADVFLKRTVVY